MGQLREKIHGVCHNGCVPHTRPGTFPRLPRLHQQLRIIAFTTLVTVSDYCWCGRQYPE